MLRPRRRRAMAALSNNDSDGNTGSPEREGSDTQGTQ